MKDSTNDLLLKIEIKGDKGVTLDSRTLSLRGNLSFRKAKSSQKLSTHLLSSPSSRWIQVSRHIMNMLCGGEGRLQAKLISLGIAGAGLGSLAYVVLAIGARGSVWAYRLGYHIKNRK